MLLELVGGPLDGELIARARRPDPLVWIDADGKCWRRPARGRQMYRLCGTRMGAVDVVYRYRHAHFEVVECGCGWLVPRSSEDCPLCGLAVAA